MFQMTFTIEDVAILVFVAWIVWCAERVLGPLAADLGVHLAGLLARFFRRRMWS